ncbi:hypothetical protein PISMIDRAFT_346504 [Pisolithus microcarpus 441]|uniref:Uncharacterized protein n=1 Tax=Pisolithus microcarpus 441 TaxID=765257 RepID=A0A0C9XQT4_9AGAM|nr:hypothetical protein PISMIDRAFT_346504 [Pisolithus microcarpus 441]
MGNPRTRCSSIFPRGIGRPVSGLLPSDERRSSHFHILLQGRMQWRTECLEDAAQFVEMLNPTAEMYSK